MHTPLSSPIPVTGSVCMDRMTPAPCTFVQPCCLETNQETEEKEEEEGRES